MKPRILLAVVLASGVLALAGCQTKVVTTSGAAPLYTVTAGGTGKTVAAPDMAEMHFGASAYDADAGAALRQASETADAITAAVKKAGVAAEDIQTANVSVYPEYSDGDGKTMRVSGYRANVQVRVKLRDIDAIGDVIGAASDAGANEVGGPSFMLSDDADVRNDAIELAIADARTRAEVMAEAAGKSLGEIISVSETGVSVPPVFYGAERAAVAYDAVAIEPGQLDISASVTVVFELK
jgi:hypothetical protein